MQQDHARLTAGVGAVLVLIAAAGLATRLWGLDDKSLWLDEAFTWDMARLGAGDIISTARDQDIHPPAHYLLLHFWLDAFGDSELSLRLPSALAAGGAFLLVAYAGWRVGGLALAALASLLLAVNPAALEYAQEARFYPFIGLLALAATLCQASYIRAPRPLPLALYVITSVTMVYTHYSAFVVLAVHALVFGWFGIQEWRDRRSARVLAGAALAAVAVAAAYVPWYAALFHQIDTGGASAIPDPSPRLAGATLRATLGLRPMGAFWIVFAAPLLVAIGLALYRQRHNVIVVCMTALATTPAALFVTSYAVSPSFDAKRASPFIPALSFLAALGILEVVRAARALERRHRRGAMVLTACGGAALVAAMAAGAFRWYGSEPYEDWRTVARDVLAADGPVFLYPSYLDDPVNYYLRTADAADARDRLRLIDEERFAEDASINPSASDARRQGLLIVSHATPAERARVVEAVGRTYAVGAPAEYTDTIWVYRLQPR